MSNQDIQIAQKTSAPKLGIDLTYRDVSWFSERVERGRKEIFAEIVAMTPDLARRLLDQNADNRKPKEKMIASIAKDIKAGHWEFNGETIKVSREGLLNDGQNRLLAILRADEPVQTLVVFGLPRKSRMTVDMGSARTAAEFLDMQKIHDASKMAAIARLNLVFKSGQARLGFGLFTKQDVIANFQLKHNEILVAYREVGSNPFARSVKGQVFLPVAYLNIRHIDTQGCEIFFAGLAAGANLDVDDPILWLRARLIESINTNEAVRSEARLEIVLRYWNAWAKGEKLTQKVRSAGAYPKILPSRTATD